MLETLFNIWLVAWVPALIMLLLWLPGRLFRSSDPEDIRRAEIIEAIERRRH
jgi:hypothetical protein